ncbi:MAG: Vitamin B12 transport ATP-binding protein BacA [Syntrophorhabdaceae bacterium PtaU1.Bin034]|nr:MAG: Vitamin B12 transport ATP-binding protein BacA [Syntrophorhabdaceae bacterium PtaU1.Bin034]
MALLVKVRIRNTKNILSRTYMESVFSKTWKNLMVFKRFWRIARLYWVSEEKGKAWLFLALLTALLLAFTLMNLVLSYALRDMMTALEQKHASQFYRHAAVLFGIFVVATPVSAFYDYVSRKTGINWRQWLTGWFLRQYFHDRAYYDVNWNREIDNPDQRISQDIEYFTVTSLSFFSVVAFSFSQLITFSAVLYSISKTLMLVLLAYTFSGTIATLLFGKKLVFLNFQQLRREADFRYGLVHVRNNAESIAFYGGEGQESNQVRMRFRNLVDNFNRLILWERNLGFVTNGYQYLIMLLPYLVIAPRFFSGAIAFGVISQAALAFNSVFSAASVIVTRFEDLTKFTAAVNRLDAFSSALEGQADRDQPKIVLVLADRLGAQGLTLNTPHTLRTLVRDLTFSAKPGQPVLIVGPSGAGKSSILRAVAGIWNTGAGTIFRPQLSEMLFLPQTPYMIIGTLRDQLLYPRARNDVSEEALRQTLELVNLADLPERFDGFDAELDWSDVLSLGEQQRLAFARLLLAKPKYAILDEATSALDVRNEALLYKYLTESSTVYVSVGHRPTLVQYHQMVLELLGGERWRLVPASDYASGANSG